MRVILLSALLMVSVVAEAQWTLVTQTDTERYFLDLSTLKKTKEGHWKFWQLINIPKGTKDEVTKKKYKSSKAMVLMDCEEQRTAFLSEVIYSGEMGFGTPIGLAEFQQKWMSVVPESVSYLMMSRVCSK